MAMRKLISYLLCIMSLSLTLGGVAAGPDVQSEVRPAGATGTVIIPDHFLRRWTDAQVSESGSVSISLSAFQSRH
jgi:hypothetical protein